MQHLNTKNYKYLTSNRCVDQFNFLRGIEEFGVMAAIAFSINGKAYSCTCYGY